MVRGHGDLAQLPRRDQVLHDLARHVPREAADGGAHREVRRLQLADLGHVAQHRLGSVGAREPHAVVAEARGELHAPADDGERGDDGVRHRERRGDGEDEDDGDDGERDVARAVHVADDVAFGDQEHEAHAEDVETIFDGGRGDVEGAVARDGHGFHERGGRTQHVRVVADLLQRGEGEVARKGSAADEELGVAGAGDLRGGGAVVRQDRVRIARVSRRDEGGCVCGRENRTDLVDGKDL